MTCRGCGNTAAIRTRTGDGWENCDKCAGVKVDAPDVYFRSPYLDPHLIDVADPKQKDGVWIYSKRQKAEIMKKLGVRELGDTNHGSRPMDKFAIRREADKRGFREPR